MYIYICDQTDFCFSLKLDLEMQKIVRHYLKHSEDLVLQLHSLIT